MTQRSLFYIAAAAALLLSYWMLGEPPKAGFLGSSVQEVATATPSPTPSPTASPTPTATPLSGASVMATVVPKGTLCVRSFEDRNGDGIRGAGEPWLGVEISLLPAYSTVPLAARTDVCWNNSLPVGPYVVFVPNVPAGYEVKKSIVAPVVVQDLTVEVEFALSPKVKPTTATTATPTRAYTPTTTRTSTSTMTPSPTTTAIGSPTASATPASKFEVTVEGMSDRYSLNLDVVRKYLTDIGATEPHRIRFLWVPSSHPALRMPGGSPAGAIFIAPDMLRYHDPYAEKDRVNIFLNKDMTRFQPGESENVVAAHELCRYDLRYLKGDLNFGGDGTPGGGSAVDRCDNPTAAKYQFISTKK